MLQLVVTVPSVEAELASHMLWALGVVAIEERDANPTSDSAGPSVPAGDHDHPDHLVELWTALGDDPQAVAAAAESFPARWRWHLVEVDESVADTWRDFATPTWVDSDLVIIPAWLDGADPTEASGEPAPPAHRGRQATAAGATVTTIRIEPGATFGMGDHPTTLLTLQSMRECLFDGATVLDVGCGSGVLSVTACVLGAARAEAIDISPASIAVTNHNAAMNGVGEQISVSNDPLCDVEGTFDIVLANILAPALIELAPDLQRVVAPAGVLVISGLLEDRSDHVLEALRPMVVIDRRVLDGWVAFTLRH